MPTNIFADILKWSEQRPAWQRDALRRLFTSGDLTVTDLDELVEICKAPHGLAAPKPFAPLALQHLPISTPTTGAAVSVVSLTHHTGVNALACIIHEGRESVADGACWTASGASRTWRRARQEA